MNFIETYPACNGCKYEQLLHCSKYNTFCFSIYNNQHIQIPCESCLIEDSYEKNNLININTNIQKQAFFHIPGIYYLDDIISLIKIKEKYPQAFYDYVKIYEIYGAFNGCCWNGRTPLFDKPYLSIQEIYKIKEQIESLGLSINLTWNNNMIEENDIYDRYCNTITELFHNGQHSITVSSPILFNYLKNTYPNYTYYQSIIENENKINFNLSDNYDLQVINKNYNNDWEKLNQFSNIEKNKIVFLCNDNCFPLCQRKKHYDAVNYCLLRQGHESSCFNNKCCIDHDFTFINTKNWPTTITPELIPQYLNNNFIHFKIVGRGESRNILLYNLCKYFIKPEFFEDIYFSLIERVVSSDYIIK